jgi:hypothetical protein
MKKTGHDRPGINGLGLKGDSSTADSTPPDPAGCYDSFDRYSGRIAHHPGNYGKRYTGAGKVNPAKGLTVS